MSKFFASVKKFFEPVSMVGERDLNWQMENVRKYR